MNLDKLFHAYDIRGIYPKPLNKEFAYKLGKALVVFLKKQFSGKISVIVGRDGRFSSLPLYKSFSKGIIKQGANLINIGQVASDSLYFALNHLKKQAGVMITGSHNPKDYNGFKIVLKGPWYLSGESGLPELKEIIKKDQFPKNSKKGDIKGYNIISEYKNHILSLFNIDDIKKKNIVVDAANGVAYKAIKKIALDIPVNLDCIYCNLDDDFSHHSPDPIKFKNIKDLCKRVKTNQADFGLAFDGDGDRTVFVDEKGNPIKPDIILALFSKYFLKKEPGASIVYNITCSKIVPEIIKKNGGKPIENRTGSTFMKMVSKKEGAILGGEISAHFCYKDNYFSESGMLTLLVMLDILSKTDKSLSQLIKPFKKYYRTNENNFRVKDRQKIIRYIADHYKDYKKNWLDGLTIKSKNWWFNARPSNTEPLLRVVVEADKKSIAQKRLKEIKNIIKSKT